MCGLWGFAGSGRPSAILLADLAAHAGRRGPDSWGVWAAGQLTTGLGLVPASEVRRAQEAHLVIGHARLSTMLGTKTAANAQPLTAGAVVLAHNGTVWNYRDLAPALELRTGNDSEALAVLVDEALAMDRRLYLAVARALHGADLGRVFAFVVAAPVHGQVTLAARAQSLFMANRTEGTYWSSMRVGEGWVPVDGFQTLEV